MNIKTLRKAKSYLLASVFAAYSVSPLANEDIEPIVEWEKKQNAEQRLEVFGDDFLGDSIDPHTGALVFSHTDVDLPGNSSLPVSLTRTRAGGFSYRDGVDAEFGDWTISVPRIKVSSIVTKGWVGQRCSQPATSIFSAYFDGKTFTQPHDYSHGIQMEIPGQGSQQVLDKNGVAVFPSHAKKVTKQHWYFTCITASDGGQGLLAHAPNGDTYRFDRFYTLHEARLGMIGTTPLVRNVNILAATEVRDVHGNWVRYQYDGANRLTSITANDGRAITLGYSGSSKLIRTVTANGEVWRYHYRRNTYTKARWMPFAEYALTGQVLSAVTQPDGHSWSFNLDNMSASAAPAGRGSCRELSHTVSLTHPYGATGTFTLQDTEHRHFFEKVARRSESCESPDVGDERGGVRPPTRLDQDVTTSTMAVVNKTVTGPSMTTATWLYSYEKDQGPSWSSSDDRTNWTKVTAPDGYHVYYHAWVGEPLSGKLVKKETYDRAGGQLLRREEHSYLKEMPIGNTYLLQPLDITTPIHTTKIVTTQSGDTFTQEYGFNTSHTSSAYSYAKPTMSSVKSNVSTTVRKTVTEYSHNKSRWILALPKKETINGRVVQENVYNSLGLKTSEKRNGTLFATYGYHGDGNFSWAKDANNRAFYASQYKRGTPQKVTRADGTSIYQYVDNFGRISSIVDAKGKRTTYGRDSMGRLLSADLPDSWATVSHSYNFNGSPTHTITKANAQTIITYDAMFRPVLVVTKDLLTNKTTYINSRYDSAGREVFMSFPSTSASSPNGIAKEYDALSRLTKNRETVYPYAQTLTSYHSKHRRTETDALGNQTHYYHYGYDGADYQDVKSIHSPLGIYTDINKNVWGEITSIEQGGSQGQSSGGGSTGGSGGGSTGGSTGGSGGGSTGGVATLPPGNPGDTIIRPPVNIGGPVSSFSVSSDNAYTDDASSDVSLTRYYYYNSQRRLCRISQADVGDTLYQYDASGWLTAYQKGASRGSHCAAPSGNGKVTLVRDAVGRIKKRDFYHSLTPDITKTYDANGNVKTVNRGGVNWSYSYNSINLPTSESLAIDGRQYSLGYGYNSAGQMTSMTYPTGKVINYNPDGLGRPRQANWGGNYYANNIQYHANGQISRLSYGNGHTFQQTLNARQLPERLLTTKGGTKALDLTYRYDKRQLITSVTDAAIGGNNRTMGYDALERLTSATGAWGSGQFSYDSLGNILTKDLGSRRVSLDYNGDNRLIRSVDTGGLGGNTGTRMFSYDSRGNTTTAGGLHFVYDYADQPVSMHGDESGSYRYDGNLKRVKAQVAGKTIYNVYNLAGKLIHIDNVSTGKRTDYVSASKMTIARVINNTPTYVHHDNVGSPVTGTNSAGSIAWRERYTPFGITLDNASANNDQAGYTGHIKDSDTGLVYMQARYYDPVIGRFYSNDPVGYTAKNPVMSFNRYLYVNNNPYKYTDPNGEFLNFAIGGLVGAAVEALTQVATEGKVTNWTKVGAMGVAGTLSGGLSIATKGLSVGQKALAVAGNTTIDATSQATASLISDGLTGDVEGSFGNAAETALNAAAGPGKVTVSAGKGKLGVISNIVGAKTPTVDTGVRALDTAITETGAALVKTAEGVAAGKIDHKLKENN